MLQGKVLPGSAPHPVCAQPLPVSAQRGRDPPGRRGNALWVPRKCWCAFLWQYFVTEQIMVFSCLDKGWVKGRAGKDFEPLKCSHYCHSETFSFNSPFRKCWDSKCEHLIFAQLLEHLMKCQQDASSVMLFVYSAAHGGAAVFINGIWTPWKSSDQTS